MVAARRRYLESGVYQPIAAAAARAALAGVGAGARRVASTRAGEKAITCAGWPRRRARSAAGGARPDISKWAVLAAAKSRASVRRWVVGTNARLSSQCSSQRRPAAVHVPVSGVSEFRPVLRPCGSIVQVDAGPDQLQSLREIITRA